MADSSAQVPVSAGLWSSRLSPVLESIVAVFAALLLVAVLIGLTGTNPILAYAALVQQSFGSVNGLAETLVRATPLALIGLGISVAFRAGLWNIGAEGQLYLGALGATVVGLYLPPMPRALHLALAVAAGFGFGAVWAGIPGYLRAARGTNEIVTTIMMNYLATFLISFLVAGPMKDTGRLIPVPQTPALMDSALLPRLVAGTRVHAGVFLALVGAVACWFLLDRTVLGYEIQAIGADASAARYGGINVPLIGTAAMVLSGGFAGLSGVSEVAGVHLRLLEGISPGYGYLAIAVALLGRLSPVGVIVSSVFFGALLVGAESMRRVAGVPVGTIYLLEGLVVLFVLAQRALRRRRRGSHGVE
jgi:simple sugar transport system permease protein